jgi:hypothetical protein
MKWRSGFAPLELLRFWELAQACARVARCAWAFNFRAFGPLIFVRFGSVREVEIAEVFEFVGDAELG